MSDKHILFSAPMVRALLDGQKSQTRRTLKPQPNMLNGGKPLNDGRGRYSVIGGWKRIPYAVGDRLWVKETAERVPDMWAYRADGKLVGWPGREPLAHFERDVCSSMFLPRKASRLTLIVEDVRVQRLKDISAEDAIAEGLIKMPFASQLAINMGCDWGFDGDTRHGSPVSAYAALWDHINGPGAWDANPFVVAYSFKVHRCNIDQVA